MKIEESKQSWKPVFFVAVGALGVLLFAFTGPAAPARHISPQPDLSKPAVSIISLATGGVPVPTFQSLGAGNIPSAAPNDGGTTAPYIEYGRDVFSGTTKTINFKNTFIVPPACTCTDDTAIAACDVSATSTTQVTFNGTTGDRFNFICVGDGT